MRELARQVGRRIQQLRMAAGLTQQQLADRIGGNYKYLGYIEQGRKNVTLDTLDRIARALGVEPYELLLSRPGGAEPDVLRDPALRGTLRRADPRARALATDLIGNILRWSAGRRGRRS